jgi:hypothetical protein
MTTQSRIAGCKDEACSTSGIQRLEPPLETLWSGGFTSADKRAHSSQLITLHLHVRFRILAAWEGTSLLVHNH